MLGAYSIICALMAAVGRLGEGVEQALSDRYTTTSLYLVVALIHLIAIVFSDAAREGNPLRSRPLTTAFGSSLIAIFLFLHLLTSIHSVVTLIPNDSLEREKAKACLSLINFVGDDGCLTRIYVPGYVWVLRDYAATADDMGYLTPGLLKTDKVRDVEGARSGSVNYGNFETLTRTYDGSYLASGWAISPEKERPADAVLLTYEDASGEPTVFAVADTESKRRDVVEALKADAYYKSGWERFFPPTALPAGATEIGAWAFDAEAGRAFELNGSRALESPR
jgi:hypothetical protein